MIVDTDVFIDILQNNKQATQKITELENQHVPLSISAVSLFELHHSIERVNNPTDQWRQIETVLESRPTYDATGAVMKKAGRIDGRLTSQGCAIGMGDTIIAATALIHESPVLTRNVSYFGRIEGLVIESY